MLQKLKRIEWLLFSIGYWLVSIFILINFNGTGKEADSIHHFLYAQFAPNNPELYFNHWAKPLFTLLASPFAQFGLIGIKVFNLLCAYGASYFIYKIVKNQKISYPIIAPFFYFIFPISFLTSFSGLTEPLCAFILTGSIYLFQKNQLLFASLLISFTPFVRSEGLILIGIFGLFFLHSKNWKALLLLGTGHAVYSIIGYFFYHDLLWVFTKIPYAHLSSHYGSGSLLHFAEKLIYLLGLPLLILFILGSLRTILSPYKTSKTSLLIFALFLTFFVAHSLFWYLEIFNSMGLKRVFAAVTPLMAIIALWGLDLIQKIQSNNLRIGLVSICLLSVIIFPFTANPAAVEWEDLNLTDAQENANAVANYIKNSGSSEGRYIYTDPYLSHVLNINPFDSGKRQILAPEILKSIQENDVIIWDNWHAVIDYGVQKGSLEKFTLIQEFKKGKSAYRVYKR